MKEWINSCWVVEQLTRYRPATKLLHRELVMSILSDAPSIDIVFCKECRHRPIKEDPDGEDYGFNIIKPNESGRCPCLVEDGWYSWMPKDNFHCGFGEREDE